MSIHHPLPHSEVTFGHFSPVDHSCHSPSWNHPLEVHHPFCFVLVRHPAAHLPSLFWPCILRCALFTPSIWRTLALKPSSMVLNWHGTLAVLTRALFITLPLSPVPVHPICHGLAFSSCRWCRWASGALPSPTFDHPMRLRTSRCLACLF